MTNTDNDMNVIKFQSYVPLNIKTNSRISCFCMVTLIWFKVYYSSVAMIDTEVGVQIMLNFKDAVI